MPTIVTATQLRTILGVSSSLYNDAYLDDIIDTSENLILPMLVSHSARITKYKLTNNVAYFTTATPHRYSVGQTITIGNIAAHINGNRVVTNDYVSEYVFTAAITYADIVETYVVPAGTSQHQGSPDYVGNSNVESAVLAVSVEVFQARTAAGGQIEGVDFSVSPFRLGRSLFNRISGLLGPYIDTETMVG